MNRIYALIFAMLAFVAAHAQIVTSSPSPLQEGSQNVVITYHADQGNKELMGLTASTPVYAHVGVITNKSDGQWAYAPSKWCDNAPKYKLDYASANTWTLNMGNLRTYFGITNAEEHIQKIAFVFRTADGSKTGRTATGGDIYVDVLPEGFQLSFSSDAPFLLNSATEKVTFSAQTTSPARIEFFIDGQASPFASIASDTKLQAAYTFKQGDQATVVAVATTGDAKVRETIDICYPAPSQQKDFPGGTPAMGATANADGSVTFCLAAPQKETAMIVGSWADYKATAAGVMNYTDVNGIRYFWTTVSGLDKNTQYPYYYIVDSDTKVGDPYARLVLDPYNDKWLADGTYPGLIPYPADKVEGNVMLAVYDANIDAYNWQVTDFQAPNQQDLIIYEMLVRDFTGTEGAANGNGTIVSALAKLPYLKELGVNAIELMPINEFSGNNSWGYNPNFYFAPDKAYGSPADYRRFIDECHKAGIAVILDVVFNQSDGLHPWYQMYPEGSNPFYNARAPHAYSVLNDWNQDNLLVQQQWTDMMAYWMQAYKVDGFRFDLVKGLGDNSSYGGNASEANTNKYNSSRVARMKALTEAMHKINPRAYSINENLAGAQEENEMAENGQLNWANINNASCQFAMGYQSESNLDRFYAPKDSRNWGSTVSYAESHDEQRVAYKQDQWGVASVKGNLAASMTRLGSLAAQMILSPGAHMIWQFGELGNATNTKNADGSNNTDPKPVLWSYFDNADRHGLYDSYKELIAIRTSLPELFAEDATFAINCGQNAWAAGRTLYASTSDLELICVVNPTVAQLTVTGVDFKQPSAQYKVQSKSYGTEPAFDPAAKTVTLAPGAYCVLVNDKLFSGVSTAEASAPRAVVNGRNIEVVGGDATLKVYDLTGAPCPSTNLRPGVYVAVVNGHPTKLLVR